MNYLNNPFVMRSVPDIAINRNRSYGAPRRGGGILFTYFYNGLPSWQPYIPLCVILPRSSIVEKQKIIFQPGSKAIKLVTKIIPL